MVIDKFKKRLVKREHQIKEWLISNQYESLLKKSDEILDNLPIEDIENEFKEEILKAVKHCVENEAIKGLDFEWYYPEKGTTAFAYGYNGARCKDKLDKSDLGLKGLAGIELKFDSRSSLIDQYFAELPVSIALDEMMEKIIPIVDDHFESKQSDSVEYLRYLIIDYFQIWNYKITNKMCEQLQDHPLVQKLKERSPFWITMTRHDRSPVAIMLIE